MPSYSDCAARIVRLAAGDALDAETHAPERCLVLLGLRFGADACLGPIDAAQLGGERGAATRTPQLGRERPVLLADEGADLSLAIDHEPDRNALDSARREATPDLAGNQRTELVADQPVDHPAGLLGVDKVQIDRARVRERVVDRALGDLVEGDAPDLCVGQSGVLGDVPGDRLALTVEIGRQPDLVGVTGLVRESLELATPILEGLVARREVVVEVDAERLGRQVPDMAVAGEHPVSGSKVALNGLRLGGRLDDHQIVTSAAGGAGAGHRSGSVAPASRPSGRRYLRSGRRAGGAAEGREG